MNEPQVNVDHFSHRPVYTVVGLLTDKSQVPAITSELGSAGSMSRRWRSCAVSRERASMDAHGRYRGLRGRIAALLLRHGVRDVGYFGPGTFEQFPVLDSG